MNESRNYNLDILRIIAALMVLTVHVGYNFEWLGSFTAYGFYGTTLFFTMSGYLIMKSLEKDCGGESAKGAKGAGWVLGFYQKRLLRLVPLYWFVLIIIAVLDALRRSFSVKFLRYFLFLQMFVPTDDFGRWNNRNGLWTMSAFILFYLAAPLIFKVCRNFYLTLEAFIIMLLVYNPFTRWLTGLLENSGRNYSEPYNFACWSPVTVFYCFFAGVTIYLAAKEGRQIIFITVCALIAVFTGFQWQPWDLMLFILVAAAVSVPSIDIRYSGLKRAVATLSGMSFALYLTHPIVLELLMPLKDDLVPLIRNKGFLAFVVLMCLVMGYLAWKYVEVPLARKCLDIRAGRLDVRTEQEKSKNEPEHY